MFCFCLIIKLSSLCDDLLEGGYVISSCAANIPPRAICSLHLPAKPGLVPDQFLGFGALPSGALGHSIGAIDLK